MGFTEELIAPCGVNTVVKYYVYIEMVVLIVEKSTSNILVK